MPTLMRKTLRDYRRPLIGWTVGICAFAGGYTSFYTQIRANPDLYSQAAMTKYPDSIRRLLGGLEDITSGAGFLQGIIYQFFVPLLFTMCAVAIANRAIAAPEESGTLELTLTLPISRSRLLLERYAALALALFAVAVASFLIVLLAASAVDLGVPVGRILAAHLGLFLLVLLFGTLTLTVGAITGRKSLALAVTGVYAVAGYVVNALAKDVEVMDWLSRLSPFRYYSEGTPLFSGVPVVDYLVLLAGSLVLAVTAVLSFDRRDVGV